MTTTARTTVTIMRVLQVLVIARMDVLMAFLATSVHQLVCLAASFVVMQSAVRHVGQDTLIHITVRNVSATQITARDGTEMFAQNVLTIPGILYPAGVVNVVQIVKIENVSLIVHVSTVLI